MPFLNPFRWLNRPLLVDLLTYAGIRWALWRYEWKQCASAALGHIIGLSFFTLCLFLALLFSGWACVLGLSEWIEPKAWAWLITAGLYLVLGWGVWRIIVHMAHKGNLQCLLNTSRTKSKKRKRSLRLR